MGVQSTDGEVEVVEFFCSGARGSIEGAEKQGFGVIELDFCPAGLTGGVQVVPLCEEEVVFGGQEDAPTAQCAVFPDDVIPWWENCRCLI